ncbi:hypothetical protein M9H77_24792 [Catharanthus roseus]|uniref:Uncharacterized protein n=1 Tax=Catharanthus roseus TaxID=4058 RepID=A0ACC0A5W7_CATRO|nr:hypothetical protein M9H77_24792 [Catharanthus roseus]
MLPRIIFCTAFFLAVVAVILLALFSPIPHQSGNNSSRPWLALSLYIQQPGANMHQVAPPSDAGALVFHRTLTEGPENTSKVVGKAQGFIIPIQNFAQSAFNIIYLTFNTGEYTGSISIQAKDIAQKEKDKLIVVGGTGSFAFARGLAVLSQTDSKNSTYHIKLHLKFPNRSQTIPG